VMERRGIHELFKSGRSLRNRDVKKVNLHLQIKTSVVVHHDVECKRVKKSENMMEGIRNELKPYENNI
jgi:hypothetical protein